MRLKITEPIVLAGFSMGGYIAWQFVRKYGQPAASLDPVRHPRRGRQRRRPRRPDQNGRQRRRVGQRPRGRDDGPATLRLNTRSKHRPELVAAIRRVVENTPPAAIAAAQRGMAARPDVTSYVADNQAADARSSAARQTRSARRDEMKTIAAAIPNAKFVEIADSGHMTTMENPAAVNAAFTSFLSPFSQQTAKPVKESPL